MWSMKRPFPLQSLLLIFIPLTVAIIVIVVWTLNVHQRQMRYTILERNQDTVRLAASLIEAEADQLSVLPIEAQRVELEENILDVLLENESLGIMIIDNDQNLIFTSTSLHDAETLNTHPGVLEALAGQSNATEVQSDDGLHVITYAPVSTLNWAIVMEETWIGLMDIRQDITPLIPILFIPIVVVALFYIWATDQWVLKPLNRVVGMARAIGQGNFEMQRQTVTGVSEVVNLQGELQLMAGQLEQAQQYLRDYAQAIQQGQEEERLRVSQELHDDTIQSLVHLDQQVQLIQARIGGKEPEQILKELNSIRTETAVISQNVRRLIQDLRPTYLDELGLISALEIFLRKVNQRYSPEFVLIVNGNPYRLSPGAELAFYRIVQESVSNAVRHSQASFVEVLLTFSNEAVQLLIADDGVGFDKNKTAVGGYGLLTLQERAHSVGAKFNLSSTDEGSQIEITLNGGKSNIAV